MLMFGVISHSKKCCCLELFPTVKNVVVWSFLQQPVGSPWLLEKTPNSNKAVGENSKQQQKQNSKQQLKPQMLHRKLIVN
jgi:hypothetical protein